MVAGDGSATDNPALLGAPAGSCVGNACAPQATTSGGWDDWPYWQVDATLGLRASYGLDASGGAIKGLVLPSISGVLLEQNTPVVGLPSQTRSASGRSRLSL